ncbi:quinohemoprotein amine dehydrogenase subunit beta, partial [Pseudomonas donghuensis]|nr:quinohemoprotein amine dehydrogenase subunit beta [Pseudomonas donghuensis]
MKAGRCAQLALTIAATACAGLVQADDTGPALKAGHEYMIVTNYPNNLHVV